MTERIDEEIIISEIDVYKMLDELLEKRGAEWWDKFYANRQKPVPFFKNAPDENLVSLLESGIIKPCKAMDVGCGNGRNAIYLTKRGFEVDAIDFSEESIRWARDWAAEAGVKVNFQCTSIFDYQGKPGAYDFIYDAGCLHHIKPHRRKQYLELIHSCLKPEGYFGLTCFNLKGGAPISDYDVYKDYSMHGGLGFSENKLRRVLAPWFDIIDFREMKEINDESMFGKDFCWAVLMKKK